MTIICDMRYFHYCICLLDTAAEEGIKALMCVEDLHSKNLFF